MGNRFAMHCSLRDSGDRASAYDCHGGDRIVSAREESFDSDSRCEPDRVHTSGQAVRGVRGADRNMFILSDSAFIPFFCIFPGLYTQRMQKIWWRYFRIYCIDHFGNIGSALVDTAGVYGRKCMDIYFEYAHLLYRTNGFESVDLLCKLENAKRSWPVQTS